MKSKKNAFGLSENILQAGGHHDHEPSFATPTIFLTPSKFELSTSAFEWLEANLELKIFRFDVGDIRAMIEQVVMEASMAKKKSYGRIKRVDIRMDVCSLLERVVQRCVCSDGLEVIKCGIHGFHPVKGSDLSILKVGGPQDA